MDRLMGLADFPGFNFSYFSTFFPRFSLRLGAGAALCTIDVRERMKR